jgi:hypothetical protein
LSSSFSHGGRGKVIRTKWNAALLQLTFVRAIVTVFVGVKSIPPRFRDVDQSRKDEPAVSFGRRMLDAFCAPILMGNRTDQSARFAAVFLRPNAAFDQVFALPAFIVCHARSISCCFNHSLRPLGYADARMRFTSSAFCLTMYSIRSSCSCVTHHLGSGLYPAARRACAPGDFSSLPWLIAGLHQS